MLSIIPQKGLILIDEAVTEGVSPQDGGADVTATAAKPSLVTKLTYSTSPAALRVDVVLDEPVSLSRPRLRTRPTPATPEASAEASAEAVE